VDGCGTAEGYQNINEWTPVDLTGCMKISRIDMNALLSVVLGTEAEVTDLNMW
jgi:hypothetical protein